MEEQHHNNKKNKTTKALCGVAKRWKEEYLRCSGFLGTWLACLGSHTTLCFFPLASHLPFASHLSRLCKHCRTRCVFGHCLSLLDGVRLVIVVVCGSRKCLCRRSVLLWPEEVQDCLSPCRRKPSVVVVVVVVLVLAPLPQPSYLSPSHSSWTTLEAKISPTSSGRTFQTMFSRLYTKISRGTYRRVSSHYEATPTMATRFREHSGCTYSSSSSSLLLTVVRCASIVVLLPMEWLLQASLNFGILFERREALLVAASKHSNWRRCSSRARSPTLPS
jgi:hypothetical protein